MGSIQLATFLSSYVFPADSMPAFFGCLSQPIPANLLIDAGRMA
jgi:hypothetical protein